MGLLKNFFVEEVKPEAIAYRESEYVDDTYDEVSVDGVGVDTFVTDVYAQNDLSDTSKSIFKVEELINSLPKEMVTATKNASVLSTLGVFGLTATEVTEDGESRLSVLKAAADKVVADMEAEIDAKKAEIESHKEEIARLEKEISSHEDTIRETEAAANEEIGRINELIEFVGGGE